MPLVAIVLLTALALVLPAGAGASPQHDRWRRPLPGAVVGSFTFDPAAPYVRGRRRGIDVVGRSGDAVRAVCSGRVTHAGRVPAWGRGVTLRCGPLVATELGLADVAVRRGDVVVRGGRVGGLGPRGVLRLGARRAGERQGYVDPERLLSDGRPWGPAPVAPSVRRRFVRPAPRPRPAPVGGRHAQRVPWPAWLGLALVLAGAGGLSTGVRRRRPGRRQVEAAVAGR